MAPTMTLLIFGASGLVGSSLARLASQRGERVFGTVGSCKLNVPGLLEQHRCNLTDLSAVRSLIMGVRPTALLNAAAISEPYRCEADPVTSARMNVELPALLAECAAALDARLIHLSSEQVFRGDAAPYRVSDPVDPINRYAEQKVESERRVHDTAPRHAATLRVPLLMGNSFLQKRSVHERLLADWASGKTPRLFADEIRQSCSGDSVAAAMLELSTLPHLCGVFHWAGREALSRYEQGVRIRAHFRLSEAAAPIEAITRAEDPTLARSRQANLALDLEPLLSELSVQPESFEQQLRAMQVPSVLASWYASAAGALR